MFCKKCGAEIKGQQKFCPRCGAELSSVQQPGPAENGKKPPVLLIGVIVIVAILCLVLVKALFMPGYNSVVKNYIKAYEKEDPELMVSLYPKAYIEYVDDEYDVDEDDLVDNAEDMMDDMQDYFDGDIKLKYSVEDVEDLRNREISDIEDYWGGDYEIKDGKTIELKIDVYVDGDKEDRYRVELIVVKIGSKWYLNPASAYSYFWEY